MGDIDAELQRLKDLDNFDAAIHKLFDDGLLSEQTMTSMWSMVHRESQEMMMLKRLEED